MNPYELLRDYSLEITARDIEALEAHASGLRPGTPVSITFLPGDQIETLADVAARVTALGLAAIPHIAARRIRSVEQLERLLRTLRDVGAPERAFVIAGDLSEPIGPYRDALDIIGCGKLAAAGVRSVGIAGYPEGHPRIPSEALARAMRDKLAAIANAGQRAEIVTQFTFDAAPVIEWIERLRDGGIDTPVRVGLAGPTSAKALLRFAARCGVDASHKVLAKYGLSLRRLLGTTTPDLLVRDLTAALNPERHGIVRAHLYPFGGIDKAIEWSNARAAQNALRQSA